MPPGSYTFSNQSVSADFGTLKGGPPDQSSFFISVDQGLNSFRPRHGTGTPTVMRSTVVFLTVFTPTSADSACYVLTNPADFTINQNLQSAALSTTLTAGELCPGFASPVGKGGAPIIDGGGAGLPASIQVAVTWTGLGVVATQHDRSTFQCLQYNTNGTFTMRTSDANASGTIDALPGTTFNTPVATVMSSVSQLTIKGTPDPLCFPL